MQQLTSELQKRESQFNSVQDRGEALVMERHPASNVIKVGRLSNLDALCCSDCVQVEACHEAECCFLFSVSLLSSFSHKTVSV